MNEDSKKTAGQKAADEVAALLRARNSVIVINTIEEARAVRGVVEACNIAQYEPLKWNVAKGVHNTLGQEVSPGRGAMDPAACLQAIEDSRSRQVWILCDLLPWLKDPSLLRKLRNLAQDLPQSPRNEARSIIMITTDGEIPKDLATAKVIDWPLPDRAETAATLDRAISGLPEEMRKGAAPNGTREAAIEAGAGLTEEDAAGSYALSLVTEKKINPSMVAKEKKRIIARDGLLEWYDPLEGGLDAVGGLEFLKDWLVRRKSSFTQKARDYGLPAPKGVLLVGQSGCGKSLTAKAISTVWVMPLLRLDIGALQSKWVGESQQNIRRALKLAEAIAPCVLWADEIEKALAGATSGAADGGVSMDALGTLLTWMQEKQGSVFVVATANDVSKLPPELLRKGRFDDMFFVDLPTKSERAAIIGATLKQFKRNPDDFDLKAVAAQTPDFTGAELAAIVPEAMTESFADCGRELVTQDIINAAKLVVPLAKTAAEKVESLRNWARGRARPASKPEVQGIQVESLLDL